MLELSKTCGREAMPVYHRFYRSYIRAFGDAKDGAAARPGMPEDDDYVTKSEFRLLIRYLGIYATWYEVFDQVHARANPRLLRLRPGHPWCMCKPGHPWCMCKPGHPWCMCKSHSSIGCCTNPNILVAHMHPRGTYASSWHICILVAHMHPRGTYVVAVDRPRRWGCGPSRHHSHRGGPPCAA